LAAWQHFACRLADEPCLYPLLLLICAAAAGAAPASGTAKPSVGGKLERPDELLPALLRQVQANPRLGKQKVGVLACCYAALFAN
jgi:hypothetical protein